MLINEIVENTNNFPLLEKDYIKDGDIIKHKGGEFVWSEPLNTFSVRKEVETSRNPQLAGVKVGKSIPQGSKAEWEILRSAGIVRSGIDKDGYSQLNPTMKTRFKNLFGKGPGSKKFSRQNTQKPDKEPGYFGKIGQDIQSQDGRGIGRKAGAAVGSAIGQAIGGIGNFFSQTGRDLDKRRKDVDKPEKEKDNDDKKNKQKVVYVPDGEPGGDTPSGDEPRRKVDIDNPDTGSNEVLPPPEPEPEKVPTDDNPDTGSNEVLPPPEPEPEVDLDVPTYLRNRKKKGLKDVNPIITTPRFQKGDTVEWEARKDNKNIKKGDIVSSVIQGMPGAEYKSRGRTLVVPQGQVLMKTKTGLYYLKPTNLISKV
jgi:hypothetical protein